MASVEKHEKYEFLEKLIILPPGGQIMQFQNLYDLNWSF
jgi:hypothetical protein